MQDSSAVDAKEHRSSTPSATRWSSSYAPWFAAAKRRRVAWSSRRSQAMKNWENDEDQTVLRTRVGAVFVHSFVRGRSHRHRPDARLRPVHAVRARIGAHYSVRYGDAYSRRLRLGCSPACRSNQRRTCPQRPCAGTLSLCHGGSSLARWRFSENRPVAARRTSYARAYSRAFELRPFDAARNSSQPLAIFTGDFLFVGSLGRPDLLGEESKQQLATDLYKSLHERIAHLPDGVQVYPGHGAGSLCGSGMSERPESTLGYERSTQPLFSMKEEPFVRKILDSVPPMPSYYPRMKELNSKGASSVATLPGGIHLEWSAFQICSLNPLSPWSTCGGRKPLAEHTFQEP